MEIKGIEKIILTDTELDLLNNACHLLNKIYLEAYYNTLCTPAACAVNDINTLLNYYERAAP